MSGAVRCVLCNERLLVVEMWFCTPCKNALMGVVRGYCGQHDNIGEGE
jgi:hypothetical protein